MSKKKTFSDPKLSSENHELSGYSLKFRPEEIDQLKDKINEMLDPEQISAFHSIEKCALTLILGSYGVGKTLTPCAYCALGLRSGFLNKVYICRPIFTNSDEQIGMLPGEVKDKMAMYVLPILQNFEKFLSKAEIEYYINKGKIEMLPTQFFRGINIGKKEMLILDECQNLGRDAMKKTVTRIANGGKIVLMGDRRQIDLRKDKDSGLFDLINFKNKDFAIHELSICHRHPIVNALCEYYDSLTPA